MKIKSTIETLRNLTIASIVLLAPSLFAANGTWTNAPTDQTWTNVLNWNGGTVPGTINNTGNNGVDTGSIATFTNAITGTIGTAAAPIIPDDGTIVNGKARMLYQLNFDGPNCGAYVFYSPSAFQPRTATQPETGVLSLCVQSTTVYYNGSYIGAAVVNPQTFLVPVQIRLPSSTTGQYGFTNNATSPLATYYFANLWLYPDATGRGVTFVFDGSNKGTNTVLHLSQSAGQTGSPSGITKQGSGTWILAGTNNFNAGSAININAGTLIVQNTNAFGAASPNVNSNGVLLIDNGTMLTAPTITLKNSGTVLAHGSTTVIGITVNTATGNTPVLMTSNSTDILTVGNAANKITSGNADSVLHVSGPGMVALPYANNYVGKWSVDTGTLSLTNAGALGTGANVNIAAGATLDLSPLGAGAISLTATGIGGSGTGTGAGAAATIYANSGATLTLPASVNLTFTPTSSAGDLTHPALYLPNGALSVGGNSFAINNASGSPLGNGTYTLIKQAGGSITSSGGFLVTVTNSGVASGSVPSIQVNGGEVDLVIAAYVPRNLVWEGGNPNTTWDVNSTANFTTGVGFTVFTNFDNVTFDSTGVANSAVNVSGAPGATSITVDTSAGAYSFSGSGVISGVASLAKNGSGTLTISTTGNNYTGGTAINNGTVKLGVDNAVSSSGAGDLTITSPGVLDMNARSNNINALIGTGTVDSSASGASALAIGNNGASGVFSGVIQNSSGALSLTKNGLGTETLSGANTYTGSTVINNGTLTVANVNALGSGASPLTINAGTLNLATSLVVSNLSGGAGNIENDNNASANTLIIQGTSATTFSGTIADGSGGGSVGVKILGGSLTFGANNTYSGGTIVGSGATFALNNSPAGVGGPLIASNNATLSLSQGSATPGTPSSITTVDGATVTFTAGALGKIWGGQFYGSATATNVFSTTESAGGTMNFNNFFGLVKLTAATGASFRFIPGANGGLAGGTNTTFEFDGAPMTTRDVTTIVLGAIAGGSANSGISGATVAANVDTYVIGTKGVDMTFAGYIAGSNNVVKMGADTLAFTGGFSTNIFTPDGFTYYTNIVGINLLTYGGTTTISNGVFQLITPNAITSSPSIFMGSSTAVIDASLMGYATPPATNNDPSDPLYNTLTNSVFTNSIFEVTSSQTLTGIGTIRGNLLADNGSVLTVGLQTGSLTVTNNAHLAGVVHMAINSTNAATCSELLAQTFAIDGTATLVVTNLGPSSDVSLNGAVFHLFNHSVNGFASVTLPTLTGPFSLQNNLSVDGTLVVNGTLVTVSTNNELVSLTLSPAATLSPTFNSNTVLYAAGEAYGNSPITVTPTDADTTATNQVIYGGATNLVASGSASGPLALDPNPAITNVVKVQVTAQDGVTVKTYTVNVSRLASTTQPTVTNSYDGANLTLTWPVPNTTYHLQAQTNSLATGLSNNWVTIDANFTPAANTTNKVIIPVVQQNGSVFYRLVSP